MLGRRRHALGRKQTTHKRMQSVNPQSSRCGEILGRTENRVLALHVDQLAYQDYHLDMAVQPVLVTRVEACLTSNETSVECVRGFHGPMGTTSFSCLALISKTTTATINAQYNNFRYLSCATHKRHNHHSLRAHVSYASVCLRSVSRRVHRLFHQTFSHKCNSADGRPACNSW